MHFVDLKAQHDSLQPLLGQEIQRVIDTSSFIRGADVDAFETNFAALTGSAHCVSVANGTDALYVALRALGAGPGDEVITTAHSWISTSETITQSGARVVFTDTEDAYFCLDPDQIESKITEKTRGIIAVHLYGQPAAMDRVKAIADKHNLWIIEDSAQAHLAALDGTMIGRFGDVATYSFYPGKNLGAMGDAGCLTTDRADIAEFATLFARHGGKNNHQMEGICSRMDGLQAALLNVKMPQLPAWNATRREAAARYDSLLSGLGDLTLPAVRPGATHVYHLYVIRTAQRDALRSFLTERHIPTVVNYPRALPFYSAYDYLGHRPEDFPIAHAHASQILSLPLHPFIAEAEQHEVTNTIRAFFAANI
ncbi:erythromycin biosynthesis sensory transduction protein eryC1 [Sulfitobacter sp. JL08]|uniref:DegT/DnrJ/EryC1/StrS family aminotransferase n=1 Tax=Sulfitobacter sp. JL08 TaxID=2070369 RepID=UPI000E0B1DD6|nr:DegT/DnrJ/EryC1/StrS family aminotransferase [Sulfitobacter sp. JL08]AXI54103.1 erythromycin biosynthesis sensory transduction protein eryC1 [Sulfitobacter sp. JL08]